MAAKEISDALAVLRPGAIWKLIGDNYADLQWLDQVQARPTETEVNSMIATLQATATAEQQRRSAIAGDAQVAAMIARLQTATSQQIDDYLTANVTSLAQARVALGAVIKVMALFVQTR